MLGAIGAAIGLAALIGWFLDTAPITTVLAGTHAPRPIAALSIATAGVALAMGRGAPRWRVALGTAAALAGLSNVVEHVAGVDFGLDEALLFGRPAAPGAEHPGRMATLTAVSVALLGASIATSVRLRGAGVAQVALREAGDRAEIVVEDNGLGFEPGQAERVFAVFARLHPRGAYPGKGMGLATVRKIAELHGGTATAEAVPDEGATFRVALPRLCGDRRPGRR